MSGASTDRPGRFGRILMALLAIGAFCTLPFEVRAQTAQTVARLEVLFLGSPGEHASVERLRDVATPMLDRGIELLYTEDLSDLNLEELHGYDAVLLYADSEGSLPRENEDALLAYVEAGGGLVPVHAASGAFPGSTRYPGLIGARLGSHEGGEGDLVQTRIAAPDHEIFAGFGGLEGADEPLVHRDPRDDRTILEYRGDEPHTWVRQHGQGRVFYTAWGHDERIWSRPEFHDLLERGIRWAAGQDVQQALRSRRIESPFRYTVLDVPFPPPHRVRLEYERTVGPMDRRSNNPRFYEMQLALSPEESMTRMVLPPGFRAELFAAEPDVVNPIAMTWDERGRLWVLESVEYPYPRELWADGGGKDRLVILEDTDQDGRADKRTVFADGFNIPTGLTFARGGVIVLQAPQTIFLRDTDGDDRADVREVLFEGWSQRDTHAGPSHLRYGLDNWIWGVMGYSGFDGTVGGEMHSFRQGVYRFRADGSKLEYLRRTSNNTWGLGFNEQGGAFVSTANGDPSTYVQFPRKHYALLPDLEDPVTLTLAKDPRIIVLSNEFRQVDWVGAYTSAAGHGVYTARAYPRKYWNRIGFVTDPTGHVVGEFLLDEDGSAYIGGNPRNFLSSDDQWFSPVVAEVGPDGNVWIADWYNYVAQHNAESDRQEPSPGNAYANPLRDRQHGRIYRIVYEGAEPARPVSLAGASPQQLVETLRHDNMLWRMHAQRLLVERGQSDVVPALISLVEDRTVDEIGLNVGAIHAIWTLHGLGLLDGRDPRALAAVVGALRHPSAGVQRNAVLALPPTSETAAAILEAGLLRDAHDQVRLAALVALAETPVSDEVGRAIFALLNEPDALADQWLREAGTLAAAVHATGFLAAAAAAGVQPESQAADPPNLVANGTFDAARGAEVESWAASVTEGEADLALVPGDGRDGGNALMIRSARGAIASWVSSSEISLKPNTVYRIGAWIRTRNLEQANGRGVEIVLDGPPPAASRIAIGSGTSDWLFHERTFTTPADVGTGRFVFALGGNRPSLGEVGVDDVVLVELGPPPGRTLESIVEMVGERVR